MAFESPSHLPISSASTPGSSDAWAQAVDHTRRRSPASFEQWFSSVQFHSFDGQRLELVARNEFVQDWVKTHFLPTLQGELERLANTSIQVAWTVRADIQQPVCVAPPDLSHPRSEPVAALRARPRSDRPLSAQSAVAKARLMATLVPKFTFANFVVGPSNELAYAAALGSAGGGGPRYNPLFIAGATGLGKTHLMHAIAHRVLDRQPEARIVYVSAEHFTNEFIEALQNHRMDEFRARYRSDCDLLLLDDIQFLAGREQTQEEFFHTFNALRDADKPIVVTSDKYPQQLQRMPERLVSRFTSGLVADIQIPQLETRVAIVRKKAELENIIIGDDIAVAIAQTIQSNVRELEGVLIRLAAKSSLTGHPIDLAFMQREIAVVAPQRPDLLSVGDIQKAVCSHFRLSSNDMLSKDRHKSVAFARQVAMYLCRQRLRSSFPELGRAFGDRDHTTVMSAVRRVESLRGTDPRVKAHLEELERRLAASDA